MFKPKIEPLSDIEISQLEELCRFDKFRLRSKIILHRDLGFKPKQIAMQLHCHPDTVWKAIRNWKRFGFAGLNQQTNAPSDAPEVIHWKERVLEVVNTPPRTLKQPYSTWSVKRLWHFLRQEGCPFGHERVRRLIKQADYRYRRTKTRPYVVHPDYGLRKAKVMQAYNDQDKDHLVLVMDQKIFLSDVGVRGREWTTSVPTIPSYQWHNGKAIMLGVYDVKGDVMYHAWTKDLKGESIRNAFRSIFRMLPQSKKITMIMDNYQGNRAKVFQKSLKRLKIKVLWLPAWSPHLSLIESKFSLVKAEAIVSMIISSVRALKMHVTRWIKYYNSDRKGLYPAPKYSWG
ncbi:MAG: IS630 family transposase [Candidatus Kariarchaeaceae archaeon]|jgi:transposase